MKNITYVVLAFVLMASCRNETAPKVTDERTADTVSIVSEETEAITASPYTVEYDEKTQSLNLQRSAESIGDANANDIIRLLNKKYQGITLDLVQAGADTVKVKIDDASKLTQQMGSAGAEAYLAELTFSLTELSGVKAVKVDFEEGDHAMPGVYTRADFANLVKK